MTNQIERPPQDSRIERSEGSQELESVHPLSNVLAELEQWFGWGTASESSSNLSPNSNVAPSSDTPHIDTNELLIETIDQELDEWEAEVEADSFEEDAAAEQASEDESDAVAEEDASTRSLAVTGRVESAASAESASLEEVLAWTTVNAEVLDQSDPMGVVDPFASSDDDPGDKPVSEETWAQDVTLIQDHPLEGLLDDEDLAEAEAIAADEPEAENLGLASSENIGTEGVDTSEKAELLTYTGPEEILIKTPVILGGTYDKSRAASITVTAEDKYPFAVVLDQTASTWAVDLSEGFYQAGARWLRVQAVDQQHRVLASKLVNLIVSENPLSVGQSLKLTVQRDTIFKEYPIDSRELKREAQAEVPAGRSFTVQRYGYAKGHLLVELEDSISEVGTTGYFYASHVELRKGPQLLAFELGQVPVLEPSNTQVWITNDTLLKQRPVDSQSLRATQMHALTQGEHFEVTGYAAMRGHFRVTLAQEIPGFGQIGYLYPGHVHLNQDNEQVAFSPDALLLSVVEPTVFKKRPVNASNLQTGEKISLTQGQVYGVLHYEVADEGHLNVTLSEALPGFGIQGYLPLEHIRINRGAQTVEIASSQIELDVSYWNQQFPVPQSASAHRTPQSAANRFASKLNRSASEPLLLLAMVMDYYGMHPKSEGVELETELQDWCVSTWGAALQLEQADLIKVAQAHGLKASFATDRSWESVRDRLHRKQPVILSGQFSEQKHLLLVIGYNSHGYFVHDSRGDALTGYRSTYGRKRFYPKAYLEKMCSDADGQVWAHFLEPAES